MTNDDVRPKGGRPPRHKGEKLSKNRTFRIRADLDVELTKVAEASGRSVSEIIEQRLMHYEEHALEAARMREVMASTARSIEMMGEAHRLQEKTLREENQRLRDLLGTLESIARNKTVDQMRLEMEDFGFRKIELDDGILLWSEPGEGVEFSLSRLEAARLAEQLSPVLQRAVAEAIAQFQEEYPHEG